jgi:hypothetical protein
MMQINKSISKYQSFYILTYELLVNFYYINFTGQKSKLFQ